MKLLFFLLAQAPAPVPPPLPHPMLPLPENVPLPPPWWMAWEVRIGPSPCCMQAAATCMHVGCAPSR